MKTIKEKEVKRFIDNKKRFLHDDNARCKYKSNNIIKVAHVTRTLSNFEKKTNYYTVYVASAFDNEIKHCFEKIENAFVLFRYYTKNFTYKNFSLRVYLLDSEKTVSIRI